MLQISYKLFDLLSFSVNIHTLMFVLYVVTVAELSLNLICRLTESSLKFLAPRRY